MLSVRERASAGQVLRGMLSGAGAEAAKGYAFIERNWYLTKRYWAWEAVWITYNIVNALSVTFIAASAQSTIPNVHFTQTQINNFILYLTIGTAIWSYVSVVFDNVTEMGTMERWELTIENTFMAPVLRGTHMYGACSSALHGGYGLPQELRCLDVIYCHLVSS